MTTSRKQPFDFDVSAYPALPKLRGLFVTGTGTGVGKTLIAGAIAQYLHRVGHGVEVFKPVATGCRHTDAGLVSGDAKFLAACAESKRPLSEIAPVCYAEPLAPNVAAERAKKTVDLDAIFESYSRFAETSEVVIVEGIGGLLCPIRDDFWVIHLAMMMDLPVVVVALAGLGTINHTLLTLHAARSGSLNVAGVVINRYGVAPDVAMETNPTEITRRGGVDILGIVPEEAASSVEKGTIGPGAEFAISQVAWETLLSGAVR